MLKLTGKKKIVLRVDVRENKWYTKHICNMNVHSGLGYTLTEAEWCRNSSSHSGILVTLTKKKYIWVWKLNLFIYATKDLNPCDHPIYYLGTIKQLVLMIKIRQKLILDIIYNSSLISTWNALHLISLISCRLSRAIVLVIVLVSEVGARKGESRQQVMAGDGDSNEISLQGESHRCF